MQNRTKITKNKYATQTLALTKEITSYSLLLSYCFATQQPTSHASR